MSTLRSEVERLATIVESDVLAITYQSLGQYRRDLLEVIRGALAQPEPDAYPPRDEWRPASEPPEDDRTVIVWCGRVRRAYTGWHGAAMWYTLALNPTHWRDVTSPGEAEGAPCS